MLFMMLSSQEMIKVLVMTLPNLPLSLTTSLQFIDSSADYFVFQDAEFCSDVPQLPLGLTQNDLELFDDASIICLVWDALKIVGLHCLTRQVQCPDMKNIFCFNRHLFFAVGISVPCWSSQMLQVTWCDTQCWKWEKIGPTWKCLVCLWNNSLITKWHHCSELHVSLLQQI